MLKRIVLLSGGILMVGLLLYKPHKTFAQNSLAWVAYGNITSYEVFYGRDAVRIVTDAPSVTNGCNAQYAGQYITDPSNPGNHAQQAALLGAALSKKQVQLAVEGCSPEGIPFIQDIAFQP